MPAETCKAAFVARKLVTFCGASRIPSSWVIDNAEHFKNRGLRKTARGLRVNTGEALPTAHGRIDETLEQDEEVGRPKGESLPYRMAPAAE